MDDPFISVPGAVQPHRVGARLEAIFSAEQARDRARARRHALLELLGVLGLPLWLGTVWPARIATGTRLFVAAAWALTMAAVLVALIGEGIAHRRRARQIATLGPLPVLRSANRRAGPACVTPAEEED